MNYTTMNNFINQQKKMEPLLSGEITKKLIEQQKKMEPLFNGEITKKLIEQQKKMEPLFNGEITKKLIEQQKKMEPLLSGEITKKLIEQQEKMEPLFNGEITKKLIEQQKKMEPLFNGEITKKLIEQQEKMEPLFNGEITKKLIEQQKKMEPLLSGEITKKFIKQQEKLQSIKLDNVCKFDNYYYQIDNYYKNLENLCYKSSINYPEYEIFFISIRNSIDNIKSYFLDQVGKLLEVESIDYRIWKPCLDIAINKSRDAIVLSIYSLISIFMDINMSLEKECIPGLIFLAYVLKAELNRVIEDIKVNLYTELRNLGIDLYE